MSLVKLGDYLFQRLKQLGVQSILGVPGDYELALLDLVAGNGLTWRGNPNELIASYAADGYARINGAAAFVSTFGPGELSAYCGVAGQFAEYVPVAHIVGYPGVSAMKAGAIMHHTRGDGTFDFCHEMSKQISAATTILTDPTTAASEIDRVLTKMIVESRPVYIGVPADLSHSPISGATLSIPLDVTLPPDNENATKKVVASIRAALEQAAYPVVIVDGLTHRNKCIKEVQELQTLLDIPFFTTAMGKSVPNEELKNYAGVYAGAGTHEGIKQAVEGTDCALWLGRYGSDFNTAEFTMTIAEDKIIEVQRFHTKLSGEPVPVKMKYLLSAMIADFKATPFAKSIPVTWDPYPLRSLPATGELTQDFMWATLGKFFQPGDVIIGETGTSAFGLGDSFMPSGSFFFNQTVWGSIGYATGSIVGVCQAIKESDGKWKRGVLVTGEGSLHLTAQAIADMLRYDLKPIIFILNNNGYTVERLIHGKHETYNEVALWDYSNMAKTFGPQFKSQYHGPIKTNEEFLKFIESGAARADCFQVVEVKLKELDAPKGVLVTGAAIDEFNKQKSAKT
ncbi:uncharacterized protein PV09_04893 [Verruconis gallopava]|uniref:Pyruvate decarboxylase n=1 Tax=Verruconis gallopava TaxID=253628 RepID=A0A0D1XNC6_9PEZI|nr:uncharacterized protein PV09_04893 [Verruconis gallopava]KIW04076.1 hypothetical protein PV09_04893 [Verruconis gallopava]